MAAVVVVDTNVLVSGLLAGEPNATVRHIVDAMLAGQFPFLLSEALLREYRQVLLRPHLQRLHGLTEAETDIVLTELTANGLWREPGDAPPAPDPGDNHLWALLATQPGSILVTGDRRLLENPPDFASVLSPKSFLRLLTTQLAPRN
jgi:putative PIN family toxin of toxin-antitoxin system